MLFEMESQLKIKDVMLTDQNHLILDLRTKLGEYDLEAKNLRQEVGQYDSLIEEAKSDLADMEEQLRAKNVQEKILKEFITQMEKDTSSLQQLPLLQSEIVLLNQQIYTMRDNLNELKQDLASKSEKLEQKSNEYLTTLKLKDDVILILENKLVLLFFRFPCLAYCNSISE
jgi:chromosome segregation ATPase